MKTIWKVVIGVIVALVLIAVVVLQLLQPVEVQAQRVMPSDLERSFTEEGVVVAPEQRTIQSLHSAQIERVLVEEGARVGAGDLLIVLNKRELEYSLQEIQARLASLEAEIRHAKQDFASVEREYQRVQSLFEHDAVAEAELEKAKDALKQAAYRIEALETQKGSFPPQMNKIRYQINNYRITAPVAGIVTNLQAEEGGIASPQVSLMNIMQTAAEGAYHVEARVLTRDVPSITEGMPVRLTFQLRDTDVEFSGEVVEITAYAEEAVSALGLEEERVKVTIMPEVPEDLSLAPGYKVDVEFVTESLAKVLIVPKTAVFTYEEADAIFVVRNGRAEIQEITTGFETRQYFEVKTGLEEEDVVIVDPRLEELSEGDRVKPLILNEE